MTPAHADRALAEEAVVATDPLYAVCRMRAATSPRRTEAAGAEPAGQRWCNVFTHAPAAPAVPAVKEPA